MVTNFRAKYLKIYQIQPQQIVRDYNAAEENRNEYAGREILELLQNAVDQKDPQKAQKVEFKLDGNRLSISNTGIPFDAAGIESIMMPNISSKRNKPEFIGNKGLGFRSILNWAEEIRIYSTGLSVAFSAAIARDFFAEQGITQPTAILVAPKIIPSRDLGDFTTTIEITLKPDSLATINYQLDEITASTFLFIENFDSLTIDQNGKIRTYLRNQNSDKHQVTIRGIAGSETFDRTFDFYTESGVLGTKNYQLAVAYPRFATNPDEHLLYSFLPTHVSFPIPWFCHGTFELTSNRKSLVESAENITLLKKLIRLIAASAERLRLPALDEVAVFESLDRADLDSRQPRWARLHSITPTASFDNDLDLNDFDFDTEYQSVMQSAKIIPLARSGYTSAAKSQYLTQDFSDFISPLPNLALYALTGEDDSWLQNHGSSRVDESDLCAAIEQHLAKAQFSINERAECLYAFFQEYKFPDRLPAGLLIDDRKRPVKTGSLYFQPFSGAKFDLPSFTSLRLIHPDLQNALLDQFGSNAQTLRETFANFEVLPYDPAVILENIHSRLLAKPSLLPEYLSWVWRNRDHDIINQDNFDLVLPSQSGELKSSDELYFGQEYGSEYYYNSLFYSPSELLAEIPAPAGATIDEWRAFLLNSELVHVRTVPQLIQAEIKDHDYVHYLVEHLLNLDFRINNSAVSFRSLREFYEKYPILDSVGANSALPNFTHLLQTFSTREVAKLLLHLKSVHLDQFCETTSTYLTLSSTRRPSVKLSNTFREVGYLAYLVRHTPWIEFAGQKYAPDQIILYDTLQNRAPGLLGISLEKLYEILGLENRDWPTLQSDLGLAEHFPNLTATQIYNLLQVLPELDSHDGSISRRLYSELIQRDNPLRPDPDLLSDFLESGQLFCHDQAFHPARSVYYSGRYLQNNLCAAYDLHFIHIPSRRNSNLIKAWLGAQPKDIRLQISGQPIPHYLDYQFQTDWEDLRIGILALRWMDCSTDADRSRIKRLKINLVSRAEISIDGQKRRLEDFSFAAHHQNRSEYYLAVPDSYVLLDDLRRNINFRKAIGELISEIFDISNELIIKDIYALINEDNRAEYIQKNDNAYWHDAKTFLDGAKSSDFIDYTEQNLANFQNLRDQEFSRYCNILYSELLKNSERQSEWKVLLSEFEHFLPDSESTDLSSTLLSPADLRESLLAAFPLLKNSTSVDCQQDYERHHQSLLARLQDFPKSMILDLINTSSKFETYLRFGRIDELIDQLKPQLTAQQPESESESKSPVDSTSSENLPEFEIIDPATWLSAQSDHKTSSPEPAAQVSRNSRAGHSRPAMTSRRFLELNSRRAAKGLRAEQIALEALSREYPDAKITWWSGYAKDQGVNLDAGDGYGYDIKLETSDQVFYIEVKSIAPNGDLKFPMSVNEFQFALGHADRYWVYLVEESTGRVVPLRNLFTSPENYLREDRDYIITPLSPDRLNSQS